MLRYRLALTGLVASFAVFLLVLADIRRAFLGFSYFIKTPWASLSVLHLVLFLVGLAGFLFFYSLVKKIENSQLDKTFLISGVNLFFWSMFLLLLADLMFLYRGVAALRIAEEGNIKFTFNGMASTTAQLVPYSKSLLMQPLAMMVNYIAAVWHATFIGILLASLSMVGLTKFLVTKAHGAGSLKSSMIGSLWALPQPFCSCCASPIAAGLIRNGSPLSLALSFLVASPMLNVTALILALMLLPPKFALLRIASGVILAVPISYLVAIVADKFGFEPRAGRDDLRQPGKIMSWFYLVFNRYCDSFSTEHLTKNNGIESVSSAIKTLFKTFWQMTKVVVPMLIFGGLVASFLVTILGSYISNDFYGVIIAAFAGVLLMIATWTEIPVAIVMIGAGLTGPAAALLVTLPAVSLPCLMILSGALRSFKVSATLGVLVAITGLLAGVLFL